MNVPAQNRCHTADEHQPLPSVNAMLFVDRQSTRRIPADADVWPINQCLTFGTDT